MPSACAGARPPQLDPQRYDGDLDGDRRHRLRSLSHSRSSSVQGEENGSPPRLSLFLRREPGSKALAQLIALFHPERTS